jgi:hypothetical protein
MEVDLRRLQRQAAEGADRHRELKIATIGSTGSGKATFARGWVVDGNYSTRLATTVFEQADEVVWLDLPLRTTFWRLLRRTVRRLRARELLRGTNRDTFRNAFLSRESVLLYALKSYRRGGRARARLVADSPHVRLRSVWQVARYIEEAA